MHLSSQNPYTFIGYRFFLNKQSVDENDCVGATLRHGADRVEDLADLDDECIASLGLKKLHNKHFLTARANSTNS